MTEWEPELCVSLPNEFERVNKDTYIQRTDIHEVEYHSLDGSQSFKGYECFSREISDNEYHKILSSRQKDTAKGDANKTLI